MKNAKKLASIVLAIIMVLALSVSAFATEVADSTEATSEAPTTETPTAAPTEEPTSAPPVKGTITVENTVEGQIYTIYKILNLTFDSVNKSYSYTVAEGWKDFIDGATAYVSVDAKGHVKWVNTDATDNGAAVAAFAKEALQYAKDNNLTGISQTAGKQDLVYSNLDLGYYLLDSTTGTICSLDTTDTEITVQEKNKVPENVKTVQEDSNKEWGSTNDADIGQTVRFKSTVKIPEGSENVVFHDEMTIGLTLLNDAENPIKVYTDDELTQELNPDYYTVNTNPTGDECDFEITFTPAYLATLSKGNDATNEPTTVYIGYSAVLNEQAYVGNDTDLTDGDSNNKNTSYLKYGDATHITATPDSTTTTYTWDFDVFKYTEKNNVKTPLSGAKFKLSRDADGNNTISLVKIADGSTTDPHTPDVYRVAKTGEAGVTEFVTNKSGKLTIKGLDSDTYYLTETEAPEGYNLLAAPETIVIRNDGVVNPADTEDKTGAHEVEVINQSGSQLPSTGGIGTTIFYVVGSILLVGAAVLLISKRRMNLAK